MQCSLTGYRTDGKSSVSLAERCTLSIRGTYLRCSTRALLATLVAGRSASAGAGEEISFRFCLRFCSNLSPLQRSNAASSTTRKRLFLVRRRCRLLRGFGHPACKLALQLAFWRRLLNREQVTELYSLSSVTVQSDPTFEAMAVS